MSEILTMKETEYLLRILLAALCGALIGLEREKRSKTAGIRTHLIVALSAALMMIVSKYGFFDIAGETGISVDASRIAAGVVTAIGFLGAGVIFVRGENVSGVTTAAGLWATVGIGIACGAGLYLTSVITTILIILIQIILHGKSVQIGVQNLGSISVAKKDAFTNETTLIERLNEKDITIKSVKVKHNSEKEIITFSVIFPSGKNIEEIMELLRDETYIDSFEIFRAK